MLPKYKRILLKLSGESLMGDKNFGLDPAVIAQYAQEIKQITDMGVQVAIVICLISCAYCAITAGSSPKFLSPIKDSPESFKRIRLYFGNIFG